jgi:hypothetical protein
MSNKRIPLKQADRDFLKIGMPAIWKRIERGQMPVALYKQGNRWFVEQDDLVAWQEQGGWGVEVPIKPALATISRKSVGKALTTNQF